MVDPYVDVTFGGRREISFLVQRGVVLLSLEHAGHDVEQLSAIYTVL